VVSLPSTFNFPAEGLVTITNTSRTDAGNVNPTEGDVLSASATVVDRKGPITSPVTFVWQTLTSGGWVSVGAGPTLTLDDPHVGLPIRALGVFLDAVGTNTQFDSLETAAVVNVDDPTTGGPVISDLAPVAGFEVSVDLSSIADNDGLPAELGVQWLADGVEIAGANRTTFTPTSAQAGKVLRVRVSFTDLRGTPVQLLSAATAPVDPGLPAITLDPTSLDLGQRVSGAAPATRQLLIGNSAPFGPLVVSSITLTGPSAALFSVQHTCTVILPDATCGVSVSMPASGAPGLRQASVVIVSNDPGGDRTIAVSGSLVVNSPATGVPTIDDTTPIEGQVLTASPVGIADVNGLTNAVFTYRWQQTAVGGGTTFTDIAGATSATLTLGQQQVNRRLRVIVGFVDDAGSPESRTSATTGLVGDVFIGTDAVDVWTGTAVDDAAFGNGGADRLAAGAGNDVVRGDAGADLITAGDGDDTLLYVGAVFDGDNVNGGNGFDSIEATALGTVIALRSVAAVERITSGGFLGVIVRGTSNGDVLDFTAVELVGIERIDGAEGDDRLTGSLGADTIAGSAGADVIAGGAGDDTVIGGTGNDLLTPGAGNDVLVIVERDGSDRVNGFDAGPPGGQDLIDLRGVGVTSATFASRVTIALVAGNTVVTIRTPGLPNIVVTLVATPVAAVDISDFIVG
jgi:hypothetical protein